jgi:hypothetical protein
MKGKSEAEQLIDKVLKDFKIISLTYITGNRWERTG